jgi:two-component system OmpR family response regulator
VLLLTAKDSLNDRIEGLDAGADDYLIKPFQLAELAARIRSTSRRAAGRASEILAVAQIELDRAGQSVTQGGSPVDLTAREYALLEALMRRAGRILSRENLEELLYGFDADVSSNTIEVHIASLRRKLGHDAIETVRGMGYRMRV